MKQLPIFFILLMSMTLNSQTVLNGSFENCLVDTCKYNILNDSVPIVLPNIFGYGNSDGIDLLVNDCNPISTSFGQNFIALGSKPPAPPNYTLQSDKINLELSKALSFSTVYTIEFYGRYYNPNQNSNQDNPIIDSLLVGFASAIGYVEPARRLIMTDTWTKYTATFTLPFGYGYTKYLGFQNRSLNYPTYNLIDNVSIKVGTPITDIVDKPYKLVRFDNNHIYIDCINIIDDITIYNSIGHCIEKDSFYDITFDQPGIYIITFVIDSKLFSEKIIVF